MNRREAIRSTAAFVIAPRLLKPVRFKALPIPTGLASTRLKAKLFLDSLDEIRAYHTALVKLDGSIFDGPKVLGVDEEESRIHIKIQPCLVKEACHVNSIRLYHPSGEFRGEYRFGFQYVNPGDTLNVDVYCGVDVV